MSSYFNVARKYRRKKRSAPEPTPVPTPTPTKNVDRSFLRHYQIKLNGGVYNRGTLAQLLDVRDIAIGEASLGELPKTINPLQFLCNNLIVNNGFVIKIKQDAIQVGNEYIKLLSDLQYVVPPEKAVLLCIELSEQVDVLNVNDTKDEVNILDAIDASDTMLELFNEYVGVAYNRDECDV